MQETTVGLISPGAMGAAVGASIVAGGTPVVWAQDGRSERSAERAAADGLTAVEDLPALVERSTIVLSICPPHAASDVAAQVAALGFDGLYVDANAIAPAAATAIARRIAPAGFVDGGIIGGPPREPGTTRLYLAGSGADAVAQLCAAGPLEAIVLDGDVPAASALKVAYASWTKGNAALLLAARAFAADAGVDDDLLAEWARSQPGLADRAERTAAAAGPKAWRFVGEMQQIAASFAAAGLPTGFHEAAAAVYDRLADRKDAPSTDTDAVVAALLADAGGTPAAHDPSPGRG